MEVDLGASRSSPPRDAEEVDVQYAFLIYCDESREPMPGSKEFDDYRNAYRAFTDETKAKGIHRESAALQPVATATTVRLGDGKPVTIDGPFAETEERLQGLYLLECEDLDEALDYAAKIPTLNHGSVEIRPVLQLAER
jgi:hypothetical protein